MWDEDEDDEPKQPYKKPPAEVGPQVILWLFFETTLRVLIPAIGCMLLGIWIGNKIGHKQAMAISGTLVGLVIAGLLVWQQAVNTNRKSSVK